MMLRIVNSGHKNERPLVFPPEPRRESMPAGGAA